MPLNKANKIINYNKGVKTMEAEKKLPAKLESLVRQAVITGGGWTEIGWFEEAFELEVKHSESISAESIREAAQVMHELCLLYHGPRVARGFLQFVPEKVAIAAPTALQVELSHSYKEMYNREESMLKRMIAMEEHLATENRSLFQEYGTEGASYLKHLKEILEKYG
ncbi:hypothetical protein HY485_05490 [Candidatus Woesearchaeota archaeon]|nr:hypothetical protein [Candidatus Woesearchaeota archaeon]